MDDEQQIQPQDQDEGTALNKDFDNKEFDESHQESEHSERPPTDQHGGERRDDFRDDFRGGYNDGPGYDYDGPPRFHGPRGGPRGYGPPMRGPRYTKRNQF